MSPKRGSTKCRPRAELADGRQAYSRLAVSRRGERDYCRGWDMKVIKAFRMKEKSSLLAMKSFPADFYLLDSFSAGYGGSGAEFPWEWLDGIDSRQVDSFGRAERRQCRAGDRQCIRTESMFVAAWRRAQVSRIMANSKNLLLLPKVPDRRGHFGPYGGRYVAETLMPALTELERGYAQGAPRRRRFKRSWHTIYVNTSAGKRRFISPNG